MALNALCSRAIATAAIDPPVITGIDHVVIGVRDLGAAISAYERLFGCEASARAERDGVATAMLVTRNVAVELMAPVGESNDAVRLRAAIDDGGEGLKSLVFATPEIAKAHRRCERVGLAPQDVVEREGWRGVRLETAHTRGVRIFLLQRDAPLTASQDAVVTGLDHFVVRSNDMDGAASLYGARLGLDLRLDREVAGRRLMFFRCGDGFMEVARDEAITDGKDRFWGLSWRVADADVARARLCAAGVNVSEVRTGFKPGTRVFTVRDQTCGVPTLMIEPSRDRD